MQVSGTVETSRGSEYQEWNWVKGSGERSRRERVPTWNWAAREGWWPSDWWEGDSPGATGVVFVRSVCLGSIYDKGQSESGNFSTYEVCIIFKYHRRDVQINFLDFELASLSSWLAADVPEAECKDMVAVRRGTLFEVTRRKSLLVLIETEVLDFSQYERVFA